MQVRRRLLLTPATGFLGQESLWRQPLDPDLLVSTPGGLAVSRYVDQCTIERERYALPSGDYYTLSVGLEPTELAVYVDAKKVFEGKTQTGAIHLEKPGTEVRGIIRAPMSTLHVFVATRLLADFQEELGLRNSADPPYLRNVHFKHDRSLAYLLKALSFERQGGNGMDQMVVESLCVAIVAHLLRRYSGKPLDDTVSRGAGLAPWRIRRVMDYIEANLAQSITLADLAHVVGLSRMHFASQFRLATGLRPHECVMTRRVARARQIMLHSDLPLISVAMAVGFESQTHFSRVFKRFTGFTPFTWRALHKR
jgi:AraC family transcriptional regulator